MKTVPFFSETKAMLVFFEKKGKILTGNSYNFISVLFN